MEQYSNEDVVSIIESEGLEYAIASYINPENIADTELRQLFINANESLQAIKQFLDI